MSRFNDSDARFAEILHTGGRQALADRRLFRVRDRGYHPIFVEVRRMSAKGVQLSAFEVGGRVRTGWVPRAALGLATHAAAALADGRGAALDPPTLTEGARGWISVANWKLIELGWDGMRCVVPGAGGA